MKLNDFAQEIWVPLAMETTRECTWRGYESVYRLHVMPTLGEMELEDITPRVLDEWLGSHPTPTIAASAWHIARIVIRVAYKYEYIDRDPTARVLKAPPKPHSEQRSLTREEADQVMDGFRGHALEAWVICAATLGLRREEACALLWGDIDLETGAVEISKGAQWVGGREVVNPPKTKNAYRTVWLAGKYLDRMRELGEGRLPEERVTPYNPSSTAQRYKRHIDRNGLPYVPPKNLRTTFATLAVEDGWDVARVSKWMGHYDPTVTMANYVHAKKEAVRQLTGLWGDDGRGEPEEEPVAAPVAEKATRRSAWDFIKSLFA